MANLSASDLAGRRIRQIRERRRWTAKELAARCADVGAPHITATVITNLETRRRVSRQITVDELLVLAHVLEVPPVLLFAPLDDSEILEVAPGVELGALDAAAWAADDDAMLAPVHLALRPPEGVPEPVRRRRDSDPLTLVRQIRVLLRAIQTRTRLLSSETYRAKHPESERYNTNAIMIYGIRLLECADRLESLGYAPPLPPEARETLREFAPDLLERQEEDMRGLPIEPPVVADARQLLERAMRGTATGVSAGTLDPALDADEEGDPAEERAEGAEGQGGHPWVV